MGTRIRAIALAVVVLTASGATSASEATATVVRASAVTEARPAPLRVADIAARLPASFDANEGQFDDRVRLVAQAGGIVAWFVDGEVVLKLGEDDPGLADAGPRARAPTRCGGVLRMRLPSAATPRGESRLPSASNWFLGNDPARWRTDVTSFGRARYGSAAPGVDVVWRGTRHALAYDVVVAPGADLAAFSMEMGGAKSLRVDGRTGDLLVTTPCDAVLRHSRPRCFQVIDGARRDVEGRFVVDGTRVAFATASYDHSRELVIDPTLQYSTYLGGNGQDWGFAIAVAPTGDIYVAGQTASTNFPLVAALQPSNYGSTDAFVTRIKADGTGLVASTYFGGSGSDTCSSLCLNAAGDLYLTGYTNSSNLPTVSAVQPSYGGGLDDAFVVRLPAAVNALTYATYLGGSGDDTGGGVAADAGGSAYVVGRTASNNFPLVNARQSTPGGGASDAFVTKLAPSGGSFVYSTFHGGNYDEFSYSCALDPTGALAVCGITLSTNLPVSNAFQPSYGGGYADGFVAKFNAGGSAFLFSTYLGGSGADHLFGVAVDAAGTVSVCGETQSTNYPTVSPAQGSYGGGNYDAVVTKFQSTGTALAFSTYLGGTGTDMANGIALDSLGGILVAGNTSSTDFPVLKSLQAGYGGGAYDGFLTRYAPGTSALVYSTYFGGGAEDNGHMPTLDSFGNVCFTGRTLSTNFPLKNAYQTTFGGSGDACVVRLSPTLPVAPGGLNAALVGTSSAHLTWSDLSSDETGFEVQRRLNAGAYTTYDAVAAGTTSYDDTSMFASQTYTYRVRAIGVEGPSTFTNEASVQTPASATAPPPPHAPDQFQALVVSPTEVALSWRDRSNDEMLFEVQRAPGGAAFATFSTTPQDVVGLADATVPPGWPVSYRVRALALQGPSTFTNPVTATTPATLALITSSGLVADSPKLKKDRVTWKGTFAFGAGPPATPIDPRTLDVRLQAGPRGAPVVVAIAAGDPAWKAKKSKFTWKSAKGAAPKVSLTIDTVKMTFSVKASGFDYSAPADTAERLLLALGGDAGGVTETWIAQRKFGTFAPPKP